MTAAKPRQTAYSASVPEDKRHCAECECKPPTRWWLFVHLIRWMDREPAAIQFRNKHCLNSPVFLCDHCTQPHRRTEAEETAWDAAPEADV